VRGGATGDMGEGGLSPNPNLRRDEMRVPKGQHVAHAYSKHC